jgi:hypothetical protein
MMMTASRSSVFILLAAAVLASTSEAFSICPSSTTTTRTSSSSSALYMANPEPIATEGDWSAYLDSENTGYIYYFNGVTGESTWEPPTDTFPAVNADDARREQRRNERREKRAERRQQQGGGDGILGGLFGGGGDKSEGAKSTSKTVEQLQELESMASNTEFLSELDTVIAEDCSVLGGEFANKKNVTASKRKKLLSNSKTNQSYSFDTDTVYTFEFYQNLFDVSVSSVDAFCCYFNYFKSLLCQLYFHTCNTGNHLLARSRLRQIRMQPYT